MEKYWKFKSIACFLLATSIVCGAFGAHALKNILSVGEVQTWQLASNYLMVQSIAILAVSFLPLSPKVTLGLRCLTGGIVLFSGSLFGLVAFEVKQLGMITPLGGILLIFGWAVIAVHCYKQYRFTLNS